MRSQKNQSLEVKMLPKPEEVSKSEKKFWRSWAQRSLDFSSF